MCASRLGAMVQLHGGPATAGTAQMDQRCTQLASEACRTVEQMPALPTLTSASPSPGTGSGQPRRSPSCRVESSNTSACMATSVSARAMGDAVRPRRCGAMQGPAVLVQHFVTGVFYIAPRV